MKLIPVLVSAPAETPVTLDEAKAHLRVEGDGEDDLITSLIEAATAHMDGWSGVLGRALVTQTWRQDFDGFGGRLRLPLAPVKSVGGITYFDREGTQRTLEPACYRLLADAAGAFAELASGHAWPQAGTRADAVSVTFECGYGGAGDIPRPIRQAILLMVGHLYEHRGDGNAAMPDAVKHLIAPYRRMIV